ncbi:MAG: four helix bundle protein [Gemmatimonadales bacterium]
MPTYERFLAWQHSHQLVLLTYKVTRNWPSHETFGLVAQVRRAAVSVAANIAEGAAKKGSREFCRFLDMANGSLAETEYLIRLARDLAYLSEEEWSALEARRAEAGRCLWALYASVRAHARST